MDFPSCASRVSNPLTLLYYRNGGAVALSSIFLSGCRAVVREKFSASQFMRDICQFEVSTLFFHVLELYSAAT